MGFGYERLKELRPDVVYVSNCGFGQVGPYAPFKSWGPIAQAMSGLTFSSGLPDQPPAGWGYSYMDHTGGYYMAIAILAALYHRARTGEGQWVDVSCSEAGASLNGPALLDYTVNGRPLRRPGMPNSNRSQFPLMAPHGIYPTASEPAGIDGLGETDNWVALACRSDEEWRALADEIGAEWARDPRYATRDGRVSAPGRARRAHRPRGRPTRGRWELAGAAEGPRRAGRGRGPPGGAHRRRPEHRRTGGCGRPSPTRPWARCASTGCPCTCRRRTGR